MKKMTNRLLSLGLVLIAVAVLTIPVLAADAVVRRDGTSGLVIETTGSVYNDNLVVAGHNYNTHFGVLFELQLGDIVTFTDVDGNAFTYTVRELTSVSPDNSDAVMNRGYALTLYTCNWDTTERVTVFCERANGEV